LTALGRFLYDFVVGDDWTLAAVVAVAILAAWLLHRVGVEPYWVLPVAVIAGLATSLRRATGARP
jgi:hypothetical protein